MILYLLIIFVAIIVISSLNIAFGMVNYGAWAIIGLVCLGVLVSIVWDLILAGICRFIPASYFNPTKKRWHVFKWERKFFNLIHLRTWKEKVPNLSKYFEKVDKGKLESSSDNDYLMQFMIKTCSGEAGHFWAMILGYLLLVVLPKDVLLTISLPVAIVNMFMNAPSVMIQRFNRPKLMAVYERNLRLKAREEKNKIAKESEPINLEDEVVDTQKAD